MASMKVGEGNLSEAQSQCSDTLETLRHSDGTCTSANVSDTNNTSIEDPFLVKFDLADPLNPRNYPFWRKASITLLLCLLATISSIGTSIISPANSTLSQYLDISAEVSVLTVSLNVLAIAFGPLLWAPLSEVYGRKLSIIPAVAVSAVFSVGTATSRNAAAVFVTRFLGGVFAAAPITSVSAALQDMYEPAPRGTAIAVYILCVAGGPTLGPIIGAAVVENQALGWRWTEYVQAIIAGTGAAVAWLLVPELYPPVVLKRKAERLRRETGDDRYWHPHEHERMNFGNIIRKYFSRPIAMLLTDPIVACLAVYASFVYGLLYFLLQAFPIVFQQHRHYGLLASTLPFLGILVGVMFAVLINALHQPIYARAVARHHHRQHPNKGAPSTGSNNTETVPEARLPPMFLGGALLVAGMFWFGWTATTSPSSSSSSAATQSWVQPTVAAGLVGCGSSVVFQQCINYLIDIYGPLAASATSSNVFMRSATAFALPLAARPMFGNLGVPVAMSLLGGVGCLALPIPLVFIRYGYRLRKMSKFAPVPD